MKIHPDKVFMLNYPEAQSVENLKLKFQMIGENRTKNDAELNKIAIDAIREFRVNINGVK